MRYTSIIKASILLFGALTTAAPRPQDPVDPVDPIDPICELTKQENLSIGPLQLSIGGTDNPLIDGRVLGFYSKEATTDRHLYLLGLPTFYNSSAIYTPTLTLRNGNLFASDTLSNATTALIISSQLPDANTKKTYFTTRLGNYRAIFDVYGGCEEGKYELRLMEGGGEDGGPAPYGGEVCVKEVHDRRWELRHVEAEVEEDADLGGCVKIALNAEVIPVPE
ncbi:hypothetical protein EX30DRAFT_341965 [Ascodesmis nigricans]|uniref:DUF7909 domain-containing protein n=1 Tax=Ascodesmis nigricans TaxID=341454 RepID=A0A4S2MTP9_9PEZI|nr:hypothetical protein EX30DRAFT_341965 [Ascodesmis nigricans]